MASQQIVIAADTTRGVRTVSCGCCSDGCVCWMHKPDRRPPVKCAFHAEHGHPLVTSPVVRS